MLAASGALVPIEELEIGDRVATPDSWKNAEPHPAELNPQGWLKLSLVTPDHELEAIWPRDEVFRQEASPGRSLFIELDEPKFSGRALITNISPCPRIERGPGRPVIGLMRGLSTDGLDLHFEASDAPVRTTATHPFYSADRKAWVSAADLRPGERVTTTSRSSLRLLSAEQRPGLQQVFNLTVDSEHCYFVSRQGLLAHNGELRCSGAPEFDQRLNHGRGGWRDPKTGRITKDPWSRKPQSTLDTFALDSAKRGEGSLLMSDLGDPRFKGWEKLEVKIKAESGAESVVHYVRNPATGALDDFKFKKHSHAGPALDSEGRKVSPEK